MQRPSANINAKVRIVFARTFLLFLLIAIHVKCADKDNYHKKTSVISLFDIKSKAKRTQEESFPEFKIADSLRLINEFGRAIIIYKPLASKFESNKNYRKYIYGLVGLGICHFYKANYFEGKKELEKAIKVNKANGNLINETLSLAYQYLGQCFAILEEPDSALNNLQKSLTILNGIEKKDSKRRVSLYNAIGFVYQSNLMDYLQAEEYYLKSIKILGKHKEINADLLYCYYNMGTINMLKGDYEKALSYGLQSLRIAKKLKSAQWEEVCFGLIANVYYYKKEYKASLTYYNKALVLVQETQNNAHLAQYFINIGGLYYSLGICDKAIFYYNKALKLSHKYGNLSVDSDSHLNLGEAYTKLGKTDSAFYHLNKCLQIKQKLYGGYNREVALAYMYLGKLYQSLNNHDLALVMFQNVFLKGIPKFRNEIIFSNPDKDQLIRHTDYLFTLSRKAFSQKEVYKMRGDNQYLLASMQSYLLVDQVLDLQRKLYDNDYSKMNFNEQSRELYDEAIECCFILYEQFRSQDYLRYAFYFMEKSKANILWENLKGAEAFSKVGIPYSIRKQESLLKAKLAFYQNRLFQLAQDSLSENLSELYHDKIFNVSKELELLKEVVALKYPRYYQIKYAPPQLSLIEAMKYSRQNNALIIEYHYGIKGIFALAISAKETKFIRISEMDTVNYLINSFQSLVKNAETDLTSQINFLKYKQYAYSIYERLVRPCLQNKDEVKNIILIPDESLSLIPFEALIVNSPADREVNYRDLPYLIKQYNVQYAYSTNIYFSERSKEESDVSLIAFDYSSGRPSVENGVLEINGTKRELISIQNVLGGRFFFGAEATESNFKKHAPSANIIHLAIHGTADTLNPLNSKLLFKRDLTNNQNGVLHSYELYNLRLNASLIVLSACETGKGKNFKGEGVMSIGRAFRYSGGSSLILSLWNINDQATSKIMGDFYNSLSQSNTLSESLRSAKSIYLSQGDEFTSHPIYWAGILAYGNVNDIIIKKSNYNWQWILVAVILVTTIIAIIFIREKYHEAFSSNK